MPRHLQHALDRLAQIPAFAEDEPDPPVPDALRDYVMSLQVYHRLGIVLPADVLADAALIWRRRVELRRLLNYLVLHYPCAELLRAMRRTLAAEAVPADLGAWLAAFPDLIGELKPAYVRRAGLYHEPFVAVPSALVWAQHFGGGEEAYRAAARAIHRDDRRQARLRERGRHGSDFLRHDLIDHGRLYRDEVEAISEQLLELGGQPLEYEGMGYWWQAPPLEYEYSASRHEFMLSRTAVASHAFAGAAWGEVDEAFYAGRLARMDLPVRQGFRTQGPGGGAPIAALVRIAERAEQLARA